MFAKGTTVVLCVTTLTVLSGCGTSPAPGSLRQSDLPAELNLRSTPVSSADSLTRSLVRDLGRGVKDCGNSSVVLFAPANQRFIAQNTATVAQFPEVLSWASKCTSVAAAQAGYRLTDLPVPEPVRGIGDAAHLTSVSDSHLRFEVVTWRAHDAIGSVIVSGPPGDGRITSSLAEDLARRAVSRS